MGRTTLDIALVGEIKGLEEVVVVGYGTQRKASLTGSVSTVDAVNLQIAPTINFLQHWQEDYRVWLL